MTSQQAPTSQQASTNQQASTAGTRVARVVVLVVATFFVIGAAFALLVVFTLAVPGTALDGVWAMKPGSRGQFEALGVWGVILLGILAVVLVIDAIGLFRRRRWARWLAVALLAANVVPDVVRGFGEPDIFILISVVAAIAVYLALPVTGRAFRSSADLRQDTMNP